MRNKIVNYHFERIKCVLEGKRLLDDAIVFSDEKNHASIISGIKKSIS